VTADQFVCLGHRFDAFELLFRYLDPELLLECHDELDEVEAVGLEIVTEAGLGYDLLLRNREHLDGALLETGEQFLIHGGSLGVGRECGSVAGRGAADRSVPRVCHTVPRDHYRRSVRRSGEDVSGPCRGRRRRG
jgi:hypothetical protein